MNSEQQFIAKIEEEIGVLNNVLISLLSKDSESEVNWDAVMEATEAHRNLIGIRDYFIESETTND